MHVVQQSHVVSYPKIQVKQKLTQEINVQWEKICGCTEHTVSLYTMSLQNKCKILGIHTQITNRNIMQTITPSQWETRYSIQINENQPVHFK